jgi:mRNA-degrading endonuclease RelE of RelBE toxin-antitoxin system
MEGRATLKLRKPANDNTPLYSGYYPVLHCDCSFHKQVSRDGEIRSGALAGNIRVLLSSLPAAELLQWAFDRGKKINGEISLDDGYEETMERIYFEQGRCAGFRLHYEPGDNDHNVVLLLSIQAERMIIGDVEYTNPRQ